MVYGRREWLTVLGLYAAYAAILLFFLVPVLWLVSLSFRGPIEIHMPELRLIPRTPTVENFIRVLATREFPVYLWNGATLALIGAAGAIVAAAPAAYAISRLPFRGRGPLLFSILAFHMISPLVIMVPLYTYMRMLKLTDSHVGAALIYVAISVPLCTWVLKGFFDGIPGEIEEAARIDGCTRFGAFWRVVLPISLPGLTAAFILAAIAGWAQFIVPFILLNRPRMLPISVGIYHFLGDYAGSAIQFVAAATVISLIPAIIFFIVFQRFIVSSLIAGSIKE